MAELANNKHEKFARLVAKGVKQGKAYVQAGYAENKGAASRLVNRPEVQERIEELRRNAIGSVSDQLLSGATMAELGLDRDWVVQAYRDVHQAAVYAKDFANGNKALLSIQKLIEDERHHTEGHTPSSAPNIGMGDLINVLDRIKGLAAPAPESDFVPTTDAATRRRALNAVERSERGAE